ncbi:hypothetical protein [Kineococcus arenarius]|uniref:hypothetical protein n=1 Tax=unclassified Kineococcus TaxID=2621656 RepID=UPI003D7DFEF5
MSGLLSLVPLSLFALAGAVAAVAVVARRVPAGHLSTPVARARRRGGVVAAVALLLAATALALGLSLPQDSLRRTQVVAVVPLAAAALHALTLLAGELTWPRPHQRVRTARLAVRTVRGDAPRGMLAVFVAGAVLALLTCLAGSLLGAADGRSLTWSDPRGGPGGSGVGAGHGPFPGWFYSVPIAAAVLVVVALTGALLLRVPARPAAPGADATTDGTLRRAAAHRALRVSTSAVLGTTAAAWFLGGTAGLGIARGSTVGVDGVLTSVGPGPAWRVLGLAATSGGLVLLLAALAVLLVPARGLPAAPVVRR